MFCNEDTHGGVCLYLTLGLHDICLLYLGMRRKFSRHSLAFALFVTDYPGNCTQAVFCRLD